jgi:hypothetical protein
MYLRQFKSALPGFHFKKSTCRLTTVAWLFVVVVVVVVGSVRKCSSGPLESG